MSGVGGSKVCIAMLFFQNFQKFLDDECKNF